MKAPQIPDQELDAIEERASKATAGPWRSFIEGRDHESGSDFIQTSDQDIELVGATRDDQDFIAGARQDIPKLLSAARAQRARGAVEASPQIGLVIRREPLERHQIELATLLEVFEVAEPLDQSSEFISFGPLFDDEVVKTVVARLERLGLAYFDDFCELQCDFPAWGRFFLAPNNRQEDGKKEED